MGIFRKVPGARFRVPGARCRLPGARFRVPDTGVWVNRMGRMCGGGRDALICVRNSGAGVPDAGYRVPGG